MDSSAGTVAAAYATTLTWILLPVAVVVWRLTGRRMVDVVRAASAASRRREEARLRSDLLNERNARLLAGSFLRDRIEQFMNRYLGNDTSPDLVEKREQLLREMIMDSLGTTPAPKFASMTDLVAFFAAGRQEISDLPHADDVKDAYIVQLNKQEDEALRRFLKP